MNAFNLLLQCAGHELVLFYRGQAFEAVAGNDNRVEGTASTYTAFSTHSAAYGIITHRKHPQSAAVTGKTVQ